MADIPVLASARLDGAGRLTEIGEPLASLQIACGGTPDGFLAIPELQALAGKALAMGLRLSRSFAAVGPGERVTGWVEITPTSNDGCLLEIARWHVEHVVPSAEDEQLARIRRELNRVLPEFSARLDTRQGVLTAHADAPDLADLAARMVEDAGRPWSDFVTLPDSMHNQPLHWRLLDGVTCEVPGSARRWTAWIEPLGLPVPGSSGFVLTLVSDEALPEPAPCEQPVESSLPSLGEELAPALRQPVNRVIAQAETIRSKLAGPLPDIYAGYAGDLIEAGDHLLALIENIAELEGVEASDTPVDRSRIDLADAARQACAILGARAQERSIVLVPPAPGETQPAEGEFRRVLQVLINLVGNAIAYSPEDSQVWLRIDREGDAALVTVADQGHGLTAEEQVRVFDKFERLGRSGDGGSGLGLYIARRLARAMKGELSVESAPGQGARFTLALPAAS